MQKFKFQKILRILGLGMLLLVIHPVAFSAAVDMDWWQVDRTQLQGVDLLLLAEADREEADDETPRSGSLVLPAAAAEEKSEKKCMTVCQKWGQDCMIDSRGIRKCRRACKEFGQECF